MAPQKVSEFSGPLCRHLESIVCISLWAMRVVRNAVETAAGQRAAVFIKGSMISSFFRKLAAHMEVLKHIGDLKASLHHC